MTEDQVRELIATAIREYEMQVRRLIATAIREHELQVAVISGILGSVLLAGSWHALWMLRGWVL